MRANKRRQVHVNCRGRDEQFHYIASQRERFRAAGLPIISVDTKKKELIGEFRNSGRTWCRHAEEVDEHDFPSAALYKAVPYGIYDVTLNTGYIFVGTSADTPAFAAEAIARWWQTEGQVTYPKTDQLLILADSGGSNSCQSRAWKLNLQDKLSDPFGLVVAVCHYPTACSKWNPIEHRLFSFITINWAGKPLRTLETMLGYIRGTSTATGLTVKAFLQEGSYKLRSDRWKAIKAR
jgi:DDE family transposase